MTRRSLRLLGHAAEESGLPPPTRRKDGGDNKDKNGRSTPSVGPARTVKVVTTREAQLRRRTVTQLRRDCQKAGLGSGKTCLVRSLMLEQDFQAERSRTRQLAQSVQDRDDELQKLRNENDDLQTRLDECNEHRKKQNNEHKDCEKLHDKIEDLRSRLKERKSEIIQQKHEIEELQERVRDKEDEQSSAQGSVHDDELAVDATFWDPEWYYKELKRIKVPENPSDNQIRAITQTAMMRTWQHNWQKVNINVNGESVEFAQHNVRGDGDCLWRAFARAYNRDERMFDNAKASARKMYLMVTQRLKTVASWRRLEYYKETADKDPHLRGRLEPNEGDSMDEDRWGTLDCVQFLADWYGVRVIVYSPEVEYHTEDVTQPSHIPNWGSDIRGSRDACQVHLIHYPTQHTGAAHWMALTPPSGWVHPGRPADDDDLMWHTRQAPAHILYQGAQNVTVPLPLDRTSHHRHASDELEARAKAGQFLYGEIDFPPCLPFDDDADKRQRDERLKLYWQELEQKVEEMGDDIKYAPGTANPFVIGPARSSSPIDPHWNEAL